MFMKKRILLAVAVLLLLVGLFEADRYYDGRLSSATDVEYMVRKLRTRVESENMWSAMKNCTVEWHGKVDESFPQELLTELAEAFRNDEVQEFVSRYEADYQILTQKEIRAYVDLEPVMHKFYETEETQMNECVWYRLRAVADNTRADDLVVQGEMCSYIFERLGGGLETGLPLEGNRLFFVNWEGDNFIVAVKSGHETESIFVYYFDGYVYGRKAVFEKTEVGEVDISHYEYLVRF